MQLRRGRSARRTVVRPAVAICAVGALCGWPTVARAALAFAPYTGVTMVADGDPLCPGHVKPAAMVGLDLGAATDRIDLLGRVGYITGFDNACGVTFKTLEFGGVLNFALTPDDWAFTIGRFGIGLNAGGLSPQFSAGQSSYGGYDVAGEAWWKFPIGQFGSVEHEGRMYPEQFIFLMLRLGYRVGTATSVDQFDNPAQKWSVNGPYAALALFMAFNPFK
jgi:hypothetical protein